MSHFGKLEEFDVTSSDVDTYFERLESFFRANQVANAAKVDTFISVAGPKTYKLLKSLLAPTPPTAKSLDELKTLLKEHVQPKESIVCRRARFYARKQNENESVTEFVAELKHLASDCDFGGFLTEALRDIFVIGLKDTETQKRLRGEKTLTFEKAVEMSLARESIAKDFFGAARPPTGAMHKLSIRQGPPARHGGISSRRGGNAAHRGSRQGNARGNDSSCMQQGRKSPATGARNQSTCYRCGQKHSAVSCKFKNAECYVCHRRGHLQSQCRFNHHSSAHMLEQIWGETDGEEEEEEEEDRYGEEEVLGIFHTTNAGRKPWISSLRVNNSHIEMEIDTGSARTIVSRDTFYNICPKERLHPTKLILKTYSGETLPLLGTCEVKVEYEGQKHQLELVVADIQGQPSILGRDWLSKIKLKLNIFHVGNKNAKSLETVLKEHSPVFQPGLGTMRNFKAKLHLKPHATPKFVKARPVPFAVRPKVEAELDKLEKEGVLKKVNHSEWGSPIVVVPKQGGKVRICGDYKVTCNQFLDIDQYPLPKSSDLFATLAGGKIFSKLDLTQAYHQMEVEEESQELLTITTHKGLYRYCRLPFGVASAPAIFQRTMEQILQGIPGVVVFMDDIELTGATEEQHLERLDQVLQRLQDHGLRLQKNKCEFMKDRVEYLGHVIDKDGIHPLPSKVQAITEAPAPTNVSELRSYLGMVQYYARFLPSLATILSPLHQLLKDKTPWEWTPECQQAFLKTKELLTSARVLTHFDSSRPVRLECDASSTGLGAVISHEMPDGSHRPVAFASRTLTPAERNYAQIEKEALGLIFGVKKFHEYLYGRHFTLVTDHKPLLTILGSKKGVPTLAAARMQRWALILAAYDYNLEFRKTEEHANADMLSRLPLDGDTTAAEEPVFSVTVTDELPITSQQIREATRKDPVLSKVWSLTLNGWPSHADPEIQPYFSRRSELSVEDGVILWGLRVIIPAPMRERLLDELHEEHPGMFRMKALARSHVWWPGIDQDIERKVKSCQSCVKTSSNPPTAALQPWTWASKPWQRIHIDFAEYEGEYYFVVVDAHSKWPEVFRMKSTTTEKTIEILRRLFSSHGLPEEVVSDNGPQFTSTLFADFMKLNAVKHTRSAPYHPATNGAAERFVQVLKKSLKTADPRLSKEHQLSNLLMIYRSTPHTVTGVSPAELFIKRQLRTRITVVRPDPEAAARKKQNQQKEQHDHNTKKLRSFLPGDRVAVRQFRGQAKWAMGTIIQCLGPVGYMVQLAHKACHVHVDHLIPAPEDSDPVDKTQVTAALPSIPNRSPDLYAEARNSAHSLDPNPEMLLPVTPMQPAPSPGSPCTEEMPVQPQEPGAPVAARVPDPPVVPDQPLRRYSTRNRRPPKKLDL